MKRLTTLSKVLLLTVMVIFSTAFVLKFTTNAGALTAVYVYLSRIQADLDGSSANETVEMVLAFETTQIIPTGGTVTIEFPDDEDASWCRIDGGLTITGATSSAADYGSGDWDIDAALPGTLSGTCSAGSGASSVDTITISGVTALSANTTYGVKITSNVGKIGTDDTAGNHELTVTASNGVTVDSNTFEIDLVADDTVVVSATVSSAPTVSCAISAATVSLGILYPGGSYASGSHTISTSSTGQGYYWAVYGEGDGSTDAGLYKSSATTKLLPSGATATLDLTTPGIEGFGLTLSDPDGGTGAGVATNFVNTTPGTFGTIDRAVAGAKLVLSQAGEQVASENSTVTYGARAGAAAPAGSYSESVTFVCGGYY